MHTVDINPSPAIEERAYMYAVNALAAQTGAAFYTLQSTETAQDWNLTPQQASRIADYVMQGGSIQQVNFAMGGEADGGDILIIMNAEADIEMVLYRLA